MNIIIVDDEQLAVDNLTQLLKKVVPTAAVSGFTDLDDALAYLQHQEVDIAFLDIELGEYNGIALANMCKQYRPNINIIFVTGYSQYSMDAFKLHASGYLLKPVRETDLLHELSNLRNPLAQKETRRLRVQTFGHFEVFVDGKPLKFTRAKCKELLAYLVDRKGSRVTYADVSAVLWEDRPCDRTLQNYTQRIVTDLLHTCKEIHMENLIIRSRQGIAIDPNYIDCDYLQLLEGKLSKSMYTGEYMSNYSWAEATLSSFSEESIHTKSKSCK